MGKEGCTWMSPRTQSTPIFFMHLLIMPMAPGYRVRRNSLITLRLSEPCLPAVLYCLCRQNSIGLCLLLGLLKLLPLFNEKK